MRLDVDNFPIFFGVRQMKFSKLVIQKKARRYCRCLWCRLRSPLPVLVSSHEIWKDTQCVTAMVASESGLCLMHLSWHINFLYRGHGTYN